MVLFYSYGDKAKICFLIEKSQQEKGWSQSGAQTAQRDRDSRLLGWRNLPCVNTFECT